MTNSTLESTKNADSLDDEVQIEGAPLISGLKFRRYRGEDDLPAMLVVLNESKEADDLDEVNTLDGLQRQYRDPKNCDLQKDMVVVEIDGELVGYSRLNWHEELDGTHIYNHWGFLRPVWRGKGIGTALFNHAEKRIREIAAGRPAQAPKFFETDTPDHITGLTNLIKSKGYEPVRHWYEMVRPNLENLPDYDLPEGIETRPVDKDNREQMHAIWAAEGEAFHDHWGDAKTDESDFGRWDQWGKFQPEYWQVAWAGDEVVGMVRNFIDDELNARKNIKRGFTENISVRRPWRKQGVARALIARSFKMHKELGMLEAALGVDTENPNGALQLYESMGFVVVRSGTNYRKPLELK